MSIFALSVQVFKSQYHVPEEKRSVYFTKSSKMFKLIVLAALIAVCYGGIPHYKVGYGFVAAGYGPHGGHGAVAKVNAHQTGLGYGFSVHEDSPHGHRYHVQSAFAPTGYGYGGYGHGGGFGHGGGYGGGFGHGGFY